MSAPFHDYHLNNYQVDCARAEIRLFANNLFLGESKHTEIIFSGVEAYHFEHDNFGTILSDIDEVALETFLEQKAEQLGEGFRLSGWPRFWRNSIPEALVYLRSHAARAFEISSSYGMQGWILARDMQTVAIDRPADQT